VLERIGAVRGERIDPGHGQERPETKRERRGIPHLDAGGIDYMGQLLPAPLRRGRERIPARL
jgi:hypothetical protein